MLKVIFFLGENFNTIFATGWSIYLSYLIYRYFKTRGYDHRGYSGYEG